MKREKYASIVALSFGINRLSLPYFIAFSRCFLATEVRNAGLRKVKVVVVIIESSP